MRLRILILLALIGFVLGSPSAQEPATIMNASFDISRELFQAYDVAFRRHWESLGNKGIAINQSHGGSSKQARAVIDGLDADVVTLNQITDIEAIIARGLIASDWRHRFPHQSIPYTSTIVFLVRKGNPKAIRDWGDLVKSNVTVLVPNPKTSGNGRYGYLAAYCYALHTYSGDEAQVRKYMTSLFKRVPIFDIGGRGASTSFVQRNIGDVLITFEAEVGLTLKEYGEDKFELVVPARSIVAEMPVALVDRVVDRRGSRILAQAYLEYLYSEEAQEIVAQHFYRPQSSQVREKYSQRFPKLVLTSVEQVLGPWAEVHQKHFGEGGMFDQILAQRTPR